MKKEAFLLSYYLKKYLLNNLSGDDVFWNWYYRKLLPYVEGKIISRDQREILTAFTPPSLKPLQCYLRIGSSDPMPFEQVFIKREYLPMIEWIREYSFQHAVKYIVDAGGNIGLTTLFLKQHYPFSKIAVIEPGSSNYNQLLKNLAVNRTTDTYPIEAGLWTKECDLKIKEGGLMDQTRLTVNESAEPTGLRGISLAAVMQRFNWPVIDMLKVDIEGTESILFNDTSTREFILNNVRFLAIEIHDEASCHLIADYFDTNKFIFKTISETTFAVNLTLINRLNERDLSCPSSAVSSIE
jgi:FkbM family methyltransferase